MVFGMWYVRGQLQQFNTKIVGMWTYCGGLLTGAHYVVVCACLSSSHASLLHIDRQGSLASLVNKQTLWGKRGKRRKMGKEKDY